MTLEEYIKLILEASPQADSVTIEVCLAPNGLVVHNSENKVTFTIKVGIK